MLLTPGEEGEVIKHESMTLKNVTTAFTVFFTLAGIPGVSALIFSQTPIITVRLANPQNNCVTQEYCLDVEFKSNMLEQEIFGMNVRFFYDDDVLELVDFRDFQGGYGPVAPNPPIIATSGPAGPALFNFDGAAEFVNGAMQLINSNAPPILLDTGEWTKIFQICFLVDDPNANLDTFCPSVVWDLEQNPENGGFLSGDDGIVITVDDPDPNNESLPTIENVVQFNWMYSGDGSPPYGLPVDSTCSNINCTLPLTLLSFKGTNSEPGNILEWETISEINVAGFDLQRSPDGKYWTSLEFIHSQGNSADKKEYSYTDRWPEWGQNYYRLKQYDRDGRFSWSGIIKLEASPKGDPMRIGVYPNPAMDGMVNIFIPGHLGMGGMVRLLNPTGQMVRESEISQSLMHFDIKGLSPGIYLINVLSGENNICQKIIIY